MTPETQARLAALRERMVATETGLVAVAPGSHMQWLLGFTPVSDERPCLLLVSPGGTALLIPALNADEVSQHTDIDLFRWTDEMGPHVALCHALSAIGASAPDRVAVDETMRADFALLVLDTLPSDVLRAFTADTLGGLRMKKDEREYALLKMNAGIADRAIEAAVAALVPGMTENELAAIIRNHFLKEGAAPSFWIVGSGSNGAFPHHTASDRHIVEGDAVVIDIGGIKSAFPSDITRVAVVGKPPEGFAELHAVVERAVQAAIAVAKPGVLARDVDAAARTVISDAGYGKFFTHRTGHGMGIDGHEPPYITATSETVLEEGMVFSIEPGIYLPGRFGCRLEEIVILRKDGPEILSGLPRDILVAKG
ncbi:M24 family metallopeptidase [Pleomorphomonas sp. PLEO]|uniref:M24 family metallopeptidase n=1 Tax=Pleomorphomonas sp. PLEO TaxID=3239306 RepID=UPI00351E1D13